MPSLVSAEIHGAAPGQEQVLTQDAISFLTELEVQFGERRRELLAQRAERQAAWDAGATPDFLPETADIRAGDWQVAAIPGPLRDRRVEITGPVDAKMMINALNSGAKVFMADLEDSCSPTWANLIEGQSNLQAAVRGTLTFEHPTKGTYQLNDRPAKLIVRPRGWHLEEAHVLVAGRPMSASLFDFGLWFFHNAKETVARGVGPYVYLPKLEHHTEAKLWDDVFRFAQKTLDMPTGTVRATVLVETLPAVFQMDEILYALKDHIVGLNAGRWDYIFSSIKTLASHPDKVLPDRAQVSMTVPHMRAYTDLLISTCHKRGAFAMGGMSAFIPDRKDAAKNDAAMDQVRADKQREADDGCDGTWVAHPDLVPIAMDIFDPALGDKTNQLDVQPTSTVGAEDLLDFAVPGAAVTLAGVHQNVDVGLRYTAAWLDGHGAVAIHGLMEDAATAEISRSQLWQWRKHRVEAEGRVVTGALLSGLIESQAETLANQFPTGRWDDAARLLKTSVLADHFAPFLTLPAYALLERP